MMTARRWVIWSASVCVALSIGFSAIKSGQVKYRQIVKSTGSTSYVSGEVLVKFKVSVPTQARVGMVSSLGDRALRLRVGSTGYALVKLAPARSVEQAINAYRAMSDVEFAQPNYVYKKLLAPNDPGYSQLWGLHNTGQAVSGGSFPTTRIPGADISAEQAWEINGGDCQSVIVAVLDTGVNYTHADLATNMWDGASAGFPNHGANFVIGEDPSDPMPADADGHGTHVAATIGAVGNNSVGTTGVCWQVQLMALRALTVNGGTTESIVNGLNFAITHGAKVVNMSFGGPGFDPSFEDEIINARNNGVVVVAAAGNDGTNNDNLATPQYPCNFTQDNVICIAALDQGFNLASFSNFGATSVDVGAPGANVLSAWPGVTIADNFSTWTRAGGWAVSACGAGAPPLLVNPSNWCTSGTYADNANDVAFQNFDLSGIAGVLNATINFATSFEMSPSDTFAFAKRIGGGDPFAGGVIVFQNFGTDLLDVSEDISACAGTTCSLGFRLASDSSGVNGGAAVGFFEINTTQSASNATQVLNGTSMATPHVSGVAATIWAYNPSYTYADVISAIKNGGRSVAVLAGKTTSGKAVDAMGALSYINPPTGVTGVLMP